MKNNPGLALFIAGAALTSTTQFLPANAVSVTQNFTANVTSGPFAGQSGTGSFTYDDALVDPIGSSFLTPFDGLTLSFTFLGQTYDEMNDTDFPDFPIVDFIDGIPDFLDFAVSELNFFNPTEIDNPNITGLIILGPLIPNNGEFETELFVLDIVATPEPSSLVGLLGVGLLAAGTAFKRHRG